MVSVRRQFGDIEKRIKKEIGDGLSQRAMRRIGTVMLVLITRRTREGYGAVRTGAGRKPLKELSGEYIKRRKRARLDPTTRPSKSNLTFTGQMLRSMSILGTTNTAVLVGPKRSRRKGGLTNFQVAELVSKERPFLFLTDKELETVTDFVDDEIEKAADNI
jgi:phage gpG-like protein